MNLEEFKQQLNDDSLNVREDDQFFIITDNARQVWVRKDNTNVTARQVLDSLREDSALKGGYIHLGPLDQPLKEYIRQRAQETGKPDHDPQDPQSAIEALRGINAVNQPAALTEEDVRPLNETRDDKQKDANEVAQDSQLDASDVAAHVNHNDEPPKKTGKQDQGISTTEKAPETRHDAGKLDTPKQKTTFGKKGH